MKRFLLMPLLTDEELAPPFKRPRTQKDEPSDSFIEEDEFEEFTMLRETGPLLVQPTEHQIWMMRRSNRYQSEHLDKDSLQRMVLYQQRKNGIQTTRSMAARLYCVVIAKFYVVSDFGLLFHKCSLRKKFFPVNWFGGLVCKAVTAANHFESDILTHEDHNEAIYDMVANQIRLYYLNICSQMYLYTLQANWGRILIE